MLLREILLDSLQTTLISTIIHFSHPQLSRRGRNEFLVGKMLGRIAGKSRRNLSDSPVFVAETVLLMIRCCLANVWSVTGVSFWGMVGLGGMMEYSFRSHEKRQIDYQTKVKKLLTKLETDTIEMKDDVVRETRIAIQAATRLSMSMHFVANQV